MHVTVRENFSHTVLTALKNQGKSKRWLYLQMNMTPFTLDSRLQNNDWRLGEIIKITQLLGLQ